MYLVSPSKDLEFKIFTDDLLVGATLQCTCFALPQFLIGRLVAGFGLGIMTTVIPIWLTESANPKSRGRMMAMQLSNLIVGLNLASWLDFGMARYCESAFT